MLQRSSRQDAPKVLAGANGELDPRQLLAALNAFKKGDFSARLPEEWTGVAGRIADAFNQAVETNQRLAAELARLSQAVGKEGKVNQRASLGDVRGSWAESVECVNALVTDLVHPTTETARVIGAVAKGDLSQTMALDLDGRPLAGEFLRTARIVNTMVEQLGAFAAEVTRVAREVGTEGKLGGQANAPGVASTWKDLTDKRLQLVREQEARRAAERENEIKDHFLATLSHELRSPLTPILGWATLLRSGHLGPEETPRALEVIERNARLQAQLIDDLLDVSRIVSGKLRMDLRPIDLRAVVEAGLEAVQTAASHRGVALSVDLGAEPLVVIGDQERLQQVVWNLATNAVKFSAKGGGVRVSVERADGEVRLRVCDDGVGISAEFLPHVFDRFQQATSGSTRTHGGLGLGLTIVRHIVEAHGGRVAAESEGLDRGACFSVLLPRASAAAAAPRSAAPAGAAAAGERFVLADRTILVVDDEADVRDVLRVVLEEHGARVMSAGSVDEALACYEARRPDLVLSDIGMPGLDGYALAERLRLREEGAVPAIALTAYASHGDAARTRAAGFRLHLAKPVEAALVVRSVAGVLQIRT